MTAVLISRSVRSAGLRWRRGRRTHRRRRKVRKAITAMLATSVLSSGCHEVARLADLTLSDSPKVVAVFVDKTTPATEWEVYEAAIEQLLAAGLGVGPGDRMVVAPIDAETLTAF